MAHSDLTPFDPTRDLIDEQDMDYIVKTREEFVNHLIEKNKFVQLAPHTLYYKDDVDVVMVYVGEDVMICTLDGPEDKVCCHWQIDRVFEDDEEFWDNALQKVLHLF